MGHYVVGHPPQLVALKTTWRICQWMSFEAAEEVVRSSSWEARSERSWVGEVGVGIGAPGVEVEAKHDGRGPGGHGVGDEAAGDSTKPRDATEEFNSPADVEVTALALEHALGRIEVTTEGRLGGLDVGCLIHQEEASRAQLRGPGTQGAPRVGDMRQQKVAEHHVRSRGGERRLANVVPREGDAIVRSAASHGQEALGGVQPDGLAGLEGLSYDAGGEAGAASEVDREPRFGRHVSQEAPDFRREDVGKQAQAFGGGVVVAEGVGGIAHRGVTSADPRTEDDRWHSRTGLGRVEKSLAGVCGTIGYARNNCFESDWPRDTNQSSGLVASWISRAPMPLESTAPNEASRASHQLTLR